jgi:hypothetical protein
MSSETDHPRQRTVAELLAEHGGGEAAATGRRRRRRESDESEAGGEVVPLLPDPVVTSAPAAPARSVPRDPVPPAREVPAEARERWAPPTAAVARQSPQPAQPAPARVPAATRKPPVPAAAAQAPVADRPAAAATQASPPARPASAPFAPSVFAPAAPPAGAEPVRENPTDVMPRFRDAETEAESGTGPDVDLFTRPIPQQSTSSPDDEDAGPSTMIGAAPVGAEDWHRARTEDARLDGVAVDDGPPLPAGPVDADEEPAGLGGRRPVVDLQKYDDQPPPPRERRLGRGSAAAGDAVPTWAGVMVQWVAGALGGAVLWVLFRFLWRNLPVVALASAVLVTVGLVVIVRALLHNDDRRTTVFAVLVGLLLTVSPAILVLLGR